MPNIIWRPQGKQRVFQARGECKVLYGSAMICRPEPFSCHPERSEAQSRDPTDEDANGTV